MKSLLVMLLMVRVATADSLETDPAPSTSSSSYRNVLAAADLGALGVVASAAMLTRPDGTTLAMEAGVALLFVGPIVHLLEHRPGRALASLGLRAVLPVLGYYAGEGLSGLGPETHLHDPPVTAYVGVLVGAMAAYGLDWFALPNEVVPTITHTSTATTVGIAMAL